MAEVPVALVILAVGLLALVGSSSLVSRMIGRARHSTALAHTASARMEWLRGLASATSPPCLDPDFTVGEAVSGRIAERWLVSPTGDVRHITLTLDHPESGGLKRDTFRTAIACR